MSFSSLPLSQNPRFVSPVLVAFYATRTSLTVIRASQQSFLWKARAYNSLLLLSSRHVLYLAAFASLISLLVTISALSAFYSFLPASPPAPPTQLSCLLPILAFSLFLLAHFLAHTHTRHRTTSLITTYFNTIRRRVTPTIEGITINA